ELHDVRPDILHLLTVLRFNGDEPIGYQTTEIQGDLRPIGVRHWDWGAILGRPIYFSRFPEGGEQLTRRRDSDRIAFDGFCHLIRRQTLPFLGCRRGNSSNQRKHGQCNQTYHREDYARLSEIANRNLWSQSAPALSVLPNPDGRTIGVALVVRSTKRLVRIDEEPGDKAVYGATLR